MRATLLSLSLLLALPALSQEAATPDAILDAGAIEAVISDQLSDFNERDVDGAWEHASPLIQGIFGSAGNFGAMVEQGYPMVWTNAEARFLELREEGGALRQKVLIEDAEGRPWILDYEMVADPGAPDGWLINGVQVLPAPDLSA